jgi:hypothetical protein
MQDIKFHLPQLIEFVMPLTPDIIELLNRLAAWHGSTLACYLVDATPWVASDSKATFDLIRSIAEDQKRMQDRMAAEIQERHGAVQRPFFPMSFTSLHDLSLEYLTGRVLQDQRQLEKRIRSVIPAMQGDPRALALAEESLGEALAHIDSLEENVAV